MAVPKNYQADPEVRATRLDQRQGILREFERLTLREGWTATKAAHHLGYTVPGVKAMRESVEAMDEADGLLTGHAKTARVDLGLALLSVVNPPGDGRQTLTAREIAAWCGCTHTAIQNIERRALRKLHVALREQVVAADFAPTESVRPPALKLAAAA